MNETPETLQVNIRIAQEIFGYTLEYRGAKEPAPDTRWEAYRLKRGTSTIVKNYREVHRGYVNDGNEQPRYKEEAWERIIRQYLRDYAGDIVAAHLVVEAVADRFDLWRDCGWKAQFGDGSTKRIADTAPMAICLAALAWKDRQKEDSAIV